jgi:voltage-gated potassium channel
VTRPPDFPSDGPVQYPSQMPIFLITRLLRSEHGRQVALLLAVAVTIVLLGGVAFAVTDGVDLGTGLYWSVTTATTVGYGDVTPHNTASRVVAVCVMLTTIPIIGSVFALLAGISVVTHLRRLLGLSTDLPSSSFTLLLGEHPVLSQVIAELAESEEVVLVAAKRPATLEPRVKFVPGEPADDGVLRSCEPQRAGRALIACADEADTLMAAVGLRALAPDLEVYALSESPRVAAAMSDLGVHHTLSSTRLVSHVLAKALETPSAGDVMLQLVDSPDYLLRERAVDGALVGQSLRAARATTTGLLLGVRRASDVDLGVSADPVLAAGDYLIELVPRSG